MVDFTEGSQGLDMEAPSPVQGFGDAAPLPEQQRPAPGLADAPAAPRAEPEKPVYRSDNPMTAALSFWRDPARLKLAAMAAAEAQRPDLLDWIKRGYEAQKENGIDAIGALAVGDKAKALQLYNASGEQAESIEEGPTKGMHTIVFADGTRRDVDAKKELYRFLTPPQQYKAQHDTEVLDVKRERDKQVDDLKREFANEKAKLEREKLDAKSQSDRDRLDARIRELDMKSGLINAQIVTQGTMAALNQARAGKIEAGIGTEVTPKPALISAIRKAAEDGAERVTDSSGKDVPDRQQVLKLSSMAEKIYRENKGKVDPATAVDMAKQSWADAQHAAGEEVDKQIKEIKGKKGTFDFGDHVKNTTGLSEKEYRLKMIKEKANAILARDVGTVDRGAGTEQAADGSAAVITPGSTNRTISMPTNKPPNVPPAPHPEGTKIKGKDGRRYTVVNGLPKLDAVQPGLR